MKGKTLQTESKFDVVDAASKVYSKAEDLYKNSEINLDIFERVIDKYFANVYTENQKQLLKDYFEEQELIFNEMYDMEEIESEEELNMKENKKINESVGDNKESIIKDIKSCTSFEQLEDVVNHISSEVLSSVLSEELYDLESEMDDLGGNFNYMKTYIQNLCDIIEDYFDDPEEYEAQFYESSKNKKLNKNKIQESEEDDNSNPLDNSFIDDLTDMLYELEEYCKESITEYEGTQHEKEIRLVYNLATQLLETIMEIQESYIKTESNNLTRKFIIGLTSKTLPDLVEDETYDSYLKEFTNTGTETGIIELTDNRDEACVFDSRQTASVIANTIEEMQDTFTTVVAIPK